MEGTQKRENWLTKEHRKNQHLDVV